MEQAVRTLLLGLGEDIEREGLRDTPKVCKQLPLPFTFCRSPPLRQLPDRHQKLDDQFFYCVDCSVSQRPCWIARLVTYKPRTGRCHFKACSFQRAHPACNPECIQS